MTKQCPEVYSIFLGTMLIGSLPSFLPYPNQKQNTAAFWEAHRTIFARKMPAVVIGYAEIVEGLRAVLSDDVAILTIEDFRDLERNQKEMKAFSDIPPGETETAFLQHSSGTTGLKKGVSLSHEAVLHQWRSYAPAIQLKENSTIASWLPLYHDMGLIACFLLPLLAGATVIQLDAFEWVSAPLSLLKAVEDYAATHVWMPNFALNHIALAKRRSKKRFDLSPCKQL